MPSFMSGRMRTSGRMRFANVLLASVALAALTTAGAAQQQAAVPDFSANQVAWIAVNPDFVAVPGGPSPARNDPAHPFVPNNTGAQPTFRIADLGNPNLKPWAREVMKRENEKVLAGGIAYTARSSCKPAGVPAFMMFIVEAVFFIQSPKEVLMIYSGNQEVRHVYLDVPHSEKPKPSWYGESVGRYDGDTLVIDTVGLNDKTFIDNYRTPHSEKLHVEERWKLIDDGKTLEVSFTVEDPDAFNAPWSAIQRYRRVQPRLLAEEACAENNNSFFDYHIPVAERPDF
jgi:hypothetical protein